MSKPPGLDWTPVEGDAERPPKRRRPSEEIEERYANIPRPPPQRLSPSRGESPHGGPGYGVVRHLSPASPARDTAHDPGVKDDVNEEATYGPRPVTAVGPDSSGDWYYDLRIIQQPQRARACGFGDKDRRPLSPPPILRLWVRTSSGQLVDAAHVGVHFLVLLVDLWSADGMQQRNVVMHPGSPPARNPSGDYDVPVASSSRPGTATSRPPTGHGGGIMGGWRTISNPLPPPSYSPRTSPLTQNTLAGEVLPEPLPVPNYPAERPELPRTRSHTIGGQDPHPASIRPLTAPSPFASSSTLARPRSSLTLPSLASLTSQPDSARTSSLTLAAMRDSPTSKAHSSPFVPPQRVSWSSESADYQHQPHGDLRPLTSSGWTDRPRTAGGMSSRPSTSGGWMGSPFSTPRHDQHYATSESSYGFPSTPEAAVMPLPPTGAANYSRVLVGSLTTVCQRLQDENGEAGLFFFAHDLGIRTEGVFTLRFTLTNITSFMGGSVPLGESERVLAEVFSDPVTVYSAKRFPGVVPTTELTRLFAAQNVRLPTRQRRQLDSGDESGED